MTPTETKWLRVNRDRPCPVCSKSDWCLVAQDGSAAICPRTESAKRCGDAGYLHRLTDEPRRSTPRRVRIPTQPKLPDLTALADQYRHAATPEQLKTLAAHLHLPVGSLTAFRVGWAADRGAWSFPMTDPTNGRVTNIRFRTPSGSKFGVKGGKESLFLPATFSTDADELLICEGATDAITAHGIGYPLAVGRPCCTGGTAHLVALVRLRRPWRVVLVRDNDTPGTRGAEALASVLALHCRDVCLIAPPVRAKDMRDWIADGATRDDVERLIRAAQPRRLNLIIIEKGTK